MPTALTHLTIGPEERMKAIEKAVQEYHAALDRREDGTIACHKAMEKIQQAFGVYWHAR